MQRLKQVLKWFIYILPATLFFSYYPVISFGANSTMNFELSLPLIWLVLFVILAGVLLVKDKKVRKSFGDVRQKWVLCLFPVFASLSVIWSANKLRGILTVGILWLVYLAVLAIWFLVKDFLKDPNFKKIFLRWFLGSTLVICIWCVVQCILDLAGVGQNVSLMCNGCTTRMFGFPHPNGFAIEPQFMGNLLIAPTLVVGWLTLHSRPRPAGPSPRAAGANSRAAALRNAASLKCHTTPSSGEHIAAKITPASLKYHTILFFIFTSTLFLTFSRGAIYAFVVGMIFFTVMQVVKTKKWRAMLLWPIVILAFIFTLNLQGIFAQLSHTNDTYFTGISKALNHLSLGVIDFGGEKTGNAGALGDGDEAVEPESVFDGYVEESTNIRMELSAAAFDLWKSDPRYVIFGVGAGGAGQALYDAELTNSPKEIVQNEYMSLLLEFGLVGVMLIIMTVIILARELLEMQTAGVTLAIIVAYAVSLCFFAGLANALQIYLLPAVLISLRKKLVS